MKLEITKNIGTTPYKFLVEGDTLFDVVMQSQKLSFGDVDKCGCCGSNKLTLEAHLAQGKYKYVSVKCRECKASVTFGVRQEDNTTYFLRRREDGKLDWRAYESGNNNN